MLPITVFLIVYVTNYAGAVTTAAADCTNAKKEWAQIKYTSLIIARPDQQPALDPSAKICPGTDPMSCCTNQDKQEMLQLGHQQLNSQLAYKWLQLSDQMMNDSIALQSKHHAFMENICANITVML